MENLTEMDVDKTTIEIVSFIRQTVESSDAKEVVVELSGGVLWGMLNKCLSNARNACRQLIL